MCWHFLELLVLLVLLLLAAGLVQASRLCTKCGSSCGKVAIAELELEAAATFGWQLIELLWDPGTIHQI
jgi:hypothetical protein